MTLREARDRILEKWRVFAPDLEADIEKTDTGQPYVLFYRTDEYGEEVSSCLAKFDGVWLVHCNRTDKVLDAAPTLAELVEDHDPLAYTGRAAVARYGEKPIRSFPNEHIQAEGRA